MIPALDTTIAHIRAEPLLYNQDVRDEGRCMTSSGVGSALAERDISTVGDLWEMHSSLPQDLREQARRFVPSLWWERLESGAPDEDDRWYTTDSAPHTVFHCSSGETTFYTVSHDGRLEPRLQDLTLSSSPRREVIIDTWDPARNWRQARKRPPNPGLYFIGQLTAGLIRPGDWGVGDMRSDELVVSLATKQLTLTAAVKAKTIRSKDDSVRPGIWEPDLERRWEQLIQEASQENRPLRQKRSATQADLPDYTAGASWLNPAQRTRPHWRDRLQIQENGRAEAPPPTNSETDTDQTAGSEQPWRGGWERLQGMALDRDQRFIAWQVLHGCLPCGALAAYRRLASERERHGPDITESELAQQALCPHCGLNPETISHMLYECPVAQKIWAFTLQLWSKATNTPAPPMNRKQLVCDDQSKWTPPKGSQYLWLHLRLSAMSALVHAARAKRRKMPSTAYTAAAYMVSHLRSAMYRDWQRTSHPGKRVATDLAQGVCCSSWLRGRSPSIALDTFRNHWARTEALCRIVQTASALSLQVSLSVREPIFFQNLGDGLGDQ